MTEFEIEQEIAILADKNAGLHDQIIDNEERISELYFELDNIFGGEDE